MKILKNIKSRGAEGISSLVCYAIIGVAAVVFALFYLIGFDIPFADNPQYNAPLLTDAVILLMWAVLLVAIGFAVWSLIRIVRSKRSASGRMFGVAVDRIAWGIVGSTVALLLVTLLLSDTSPIRINGQLYSDALWLRVAGMFVVSCMLMLVAALGAVAFCIFRANRKEKG